MKVTCIFLCYMFSNSTYDWRNAAWINVFENKMLIIMHGKTDDWIFVTTTNLNMITKVHHLPLTACLWYHLFTLSCLWTSLTTLLFSRSKKPVCSGLVSFQRAILDVCYSDYQSSFERYKTSDMSWVILCFYHLFHGAWLWHPEVSLWLFIQCEQNPFNSI